MLTGTSTINDGLRSHGLKQMILAIVADEYFINQGLNSVDGIFSMYEPDGYTLSEIETAINELEAEGFLTIA
jgi:hypothetical protein